MNDERSTGTAENAGPARVDGIVSLPAFQWEGDLDDDCTLRVGDYVGRAECMGGVTVRGDDGDKPFRSEDWWCAVYRGKDQLFHSGEPGGSIHMGTMARAVCEAIIRAALGVAS